MLEKMAYPIMHDEDVSESRYRQTAGSCAIHNIGIDILEFAKDVYGPVKFETTTMSYICGECDCFFEEGFCSVTQA